MSRARLRTAIVINETRKTTLGDRIEIADRGKLRMKGLLGRDRLDHGGGLWIIPCEAVHTCWMKFTIDLVYLNRKRRVAKIKRGVPAWRISGALLAHSVLELPAGTIEETLTRKGDQIAITIT